MDKNNILTDCFLFKTIQGKKRRSFHSSRKIRFWYGWRRLQRWKSEWKPFTILYSMWLLEKSAWFVKLWEILPSDVMPRIQKWLSEGILSSSKLQNYLEFFKIRIISKKVERYVSNIIFTSIVIFDRLSFPRGAMSNNDTGHHPFN